MSDSHDESTAVAEPVVTTRTEPKSKTDPNTKTRRQPPYNVIIMNDDDHSFEYVIEMLGKLFGHGVTTAEVMAWTIHTQGRAIVLTTHKELAELKRDQVLAFGPDPRLPRSNRSLDCYIEPAPMD
jgi:ATP-dependent Clp protease adaptor protein ClpS